MGWIVGDATLDGSETGTSFRQMLGFMDVGFGLHDTMIYHKNGASYPSQIRYYQVFEYMFILSKGRPKTVNLLRDRRNNWRGSWGKRTSRDREGRLRLGDKVPWSEYGVRYNVWYVYTGAGFSTKDRIAFEHPAIFPETLARDHIRSWSSKGDLVLDPMCGSGTTCKMALLYDRHFIGIDISPEYCEIANRRLSALKPDFFIPAHDMGTS